MLKERVLVVGDSHGNLGFVSAALALATRMNATQVHVVGDFGYWEHERIGVDFLDQVDKQAGEIGITVTWTCGNHENFDLLYQYPTDDDGWRRIRKNIWHAPRGHIWDWGGASFMAMGGAHSIDGPGGIWHQVRGPKYARGIMEDDIDYGNWWPQETITQEEVDRALQNIKSWGVPIDVLFAHDAPTSVPLPFNGYPAADANRAKLEAVYQAAKPDVFVHGHYHIFQQYYDYGMECSCITLDCDMAENGGQYMWIDVEKGNVDIVVPDWKR